MQFMKRPVARRLELWNSGASFRRDSLRGLDPCSPRKPRLGCIIPVYFGSGRLVSSSTGQGPAGHSPRGEGLLKGKAGRERPRTLMAGSRGTDLSGGAGVPRARPSGPGFSLGPQTFPFTCWLGAWTPPACFRDFQTLLGKLGSKGPGTGGQIPTPALARPPLTSCQSHLCLLFWPGTHGIITTVSG